MLYRTAYLNPFITTLNLLSPMRNLCSIYEQFMSDIPNDISIVTISDNQNNIIQLVYNTTSAYKYAFFSINYENFIKKN